MIDDDYEQFENDDTAEAAAAEVPTAEAEPKDAPRRRNRKTPAADPPAKDDDTVPEGLPATRARREEAADPDEVVVEHKGVTIAVPADQGQWPLDAYDLLARGLTVPGLRLLIGPEQWSALLASGARVNDAHQVMDKIADGLGLGSAGK